MNVLVTGSNGQLGSHLRLLGAESQHRYFFTDIDDLDITRRDAVLNFVLTNGINVVVNCAAYTNVDRAEDEESAAELVNSLAVRHLADSMKVSGGTLIHISTDYVFGGNGYNTPCNEDATLNPTGAYGRTKMHGEEAIAEVGCHCVLIRTGWLYSEFGNNFVKTMLRITGERDMCKVVFDQVGTPTYAGDLARVIFDMVENESYRGKDGIYHYSNEGVCSWYDFALEIQRQSGRRDCKIQPCHSYEFPSKVVRPPYSVLDKTKIKETFGIEIPHWTVSLAKCMENLKSNKFKTV
ncbi:MAG: dTDP-4-dehydrorhamnose reductase [Bacteroidales bacterium]|nr:dTDP-4-dehydrorhamnose reductase [Bacteroidales bacterium]